MTVIITGANRGLGYATALALAKERSRTLVLACRDMTSAIAAANKIKAATGNDHIVPMYLDLASLATVRRFVADFQALTLPELKVIICNAGVSKTTVQDKSAEGYELTFAVNHLGHFLLVHLLLGQLAPPARILFVSSGLHDAAKTRGAMQPPRYVNAEFAAYPTRDPALLKDDAQAGDQAYATSKLCNVMCTVEFARRLQIAGYTDITVNAFNPGLMAGTGLGRASKGWTRFIWYYILPLLRPLMGKVARTPQQSGTGLAYLATAPEVAEVTATYFDGRQRQEPAAAARDQTKTTELWESSIALTHLQSDETILPIGATP
ncbi:MAG: SDR family NAD(P)-dependent oxidoreductase [Caldilineaceae bacterium]